MGSYTAEKAFNFEFDGDQITCVMNNPTVQAIKKIAPLLDKNKTVQGDDAKVTMSMVDSMDMVQLVAPVLKESVVSLHGVFDANGEPVELDTILARFHFIGLVSTLVSNLFAMGEVGSDDEKKSLDTSTPSDKTMGVEHEPIT